MRYTSYKTKTNKTKNTKQKTESQSRIDSTEKLDT